MKRISGVLALIAALSVATPALAADAPNAREAKQITHAIKKKLKQEGSPAAARVRVDGIAISTFDHHWAYARIHAKNADPAEVALQQRHGHWVVRSLGTAQVQCGIGMPKKIQQELFASTNCSA